jgi:RNA polymerase sigma-70 factor (ECF subfamily)
MASAPDDTALFRAFQERGDPSALAALFDAQAPRLLLLAAHFARDAAEAEDLVQTTFLHALKDASAFDGARPVGAWLAGILRHRALDLMRRRERRPEAELLPEHETLAESAAGPLELAERTDLFERIVAAIDTIDEPFREVLLLRLVHGFEPTVIAHTLGRAPGTVRMQLKRGLERLREVLPASLAVVLATFALDGRGLAAVREAALAAAPLAAPAATGVATGSALAPTVLAPATTSSLLALAAMKNWIVAAAFVFVSAGLWFALDEREPELAANETRSSAVAETAQLDAEPPALARSGALAATDDTSAARTALAPETLAPSLVVALFDLADDTPRPGIAVEVAPRSGGASLRATTDEHGEAHFAEGLANGAYVVTFDLVCGVRHTQVDGPTRLVWHVPTGVAVTGRVFTLAEEPAAGARIWRLDAERPNLHVLVAHCDDEGRFAIAGLEENVELFATLNGHQRSEPDRAKDGENMRLVLGARGHRVSGRVSDTSGAPVPFARLVFASDEDAREAWLGSDASPGSESRAKALDLEGSLSIADADGRYSIDEVPAGFVLVVARSADPAAPTVGFATSNIAFGNEAHVNVVLERGARLFGHVRAASGAPIAGALVTAEWEGTDELGQLEDDVGALLSNARGVFTDANGAYELVGLLPGEHDVLLHSSTGQEWERFDLELARGEARGWSPVVASAHEQRLRLTAHDGAPLGDFDARVVGGTPSTLAGRSSGTSTSDADGLLVLFGLEPGATFDVELHSDRRSLKGLVRRGLVATEGEIAIALEPHEYSRAVLTGSVGLPMHLELVAVESGATRRTQTSRDGAFEFTEVAAGEHRLVTAGRGFPEGEELARITLLADEHRDLGGVALPAFGRVRLELACDDGSPVTPWRAELCAADGSPTGSFARTSDGWLSTPLRPGTHTLRVDASDAAPFTTTIEVAGLPLETVRLSCPRGAPLRLVIAPYTNSSGTPQSVDVRITTADGTELLRREFERDEDAPTFEIVAHVPPGAAFVRVRDASPARRGSFDGQVEVAAEGTALEVALD